MAEQGNVDRATEKYHTDLWEHGREEADRRADFMAEHVKVIPVTMPRKAEPGFHTCTECGRDDVDPLCVFPGGRCLVCWEPCGEAEARTMTADKLARMWGAK